MGSGLCSERARLKTEEVVVKKDLVLVCGRPCAYQRGSLLPWPPELPGTQNFATGDMPTIAAYLQALGEELVTVQEKMAKLEEQRSDDQEKIRQLEERLSSLSNRSWRERNT